MNSSRLVAAIFCLLVILAGAQSASAQQRAHPLYEPPDRGLLDGLPNLFLNAGVSATGKWSDRTPAFAVDGNRTDRGAHWACEKIPVQLTVDLGERRPIGAVRLWNYWDGTRFYQYVIEGSADGVEWEILADQRENTTPATAAGETFLFTPRNVRHVRTTFTHNSAGDKAGGHIVEIEGFELDAERAAAETARRAAWAGVPAGLQGVFGSLDEHHARNAVPELAAGGASTARAWRGTAWRGERVSAQLVLWTSSPVEQVRLGAEPFRRANAEEEDQDAFLPDPAFVRYVRGGDRIVPDVIDTAGTLDLEAQTARPVWITIDVPEDVPPGLYRSCVTVLGAGGVRLPFDLELEILPLVLPPTAEWRFHLDLWQNPYSVARCHDVELWSDAHFTVLEPVLRMLAEAGQKCLTTTIVHQPWGGQTYDAFDSMVQWTRAADGTFEYDYALFDRYVEFGARCGLDKWINCYSMVPWTSKVHYIDETTGDLAALTVKAGEPLFEEIWRPFLTDFCAHLREKGWLERTAIAMDERPIELMQPTIELVRDAAPGLRIALAGSNEPELKDDIDDWCVFVTPPLDEAIARARAERGLETTFYVCCGPARPNTFTFSPPAESAWLGIYAAAKGYTGFLRWAYNSWVDDPLLDTKHVTWPAGDCFVVYPGPRSSIHFERLREGIEEFEKIRIVRALAAAVTDDDVVKAAAALDAALARFSYDAVNREPAALFVDAAEGAVIELSRALSRAMTPRKPSGR